MAIAEQNLQRAGLTILTSHSLADRDELQSEYRAAVALLPPPLPRGKSAFALVSRPMKSTARQSHQVALQPAIRQGHRPVDHSKFAINGVGAFGRALDVRMLASSESGDGSSLKKGTVLRSGLRPSSVRADGLESAGLRFADASVASTTGPVFCADDLQPGQKLTPAQAIKGLYAAFNARDAVCAASFLADDCVYEDLLLGPATICRGKKAFMTALQFHPAFISNRVFSALPYSELLPDLTLEVDSVAEGVETVGVEWHVQLGTSDFPLGRGLSHVRVSTMTGKIERVVDIAEAPWRVVGLLVAPFIDVFRVLSTLNLFGANATAAAVGKPDSGVSARYEGMLEAVLADGRVDPEERALLAGAAAEIGLSDAERARILSRFGWTEEDFRAGVRAIDEK